MTDYLPDQTSIPDKARAVAGFATDAALGTGAVGAWILEIEKIIGALGAAVIFVLAVGTAVYRFLYWRRKATREKEALDWDRMR